MNSETIQFDSIFNVSDDVTKVFKDFKKIRKIEHSATIIVSINNETNDVVLDNIDGEVVVRDKPLEEIAEEAVAEYLPKHIFRIPHVHTRDGRSAYPLCLVWYCPQSTQTDLNMKYASLRLKLVELLSPQKLFQISNHEELTDEFLLEELDM